MLRLNNNKKKVIKDPQGCFNYLLKSLFAAAGL